MFSFHCLPEKPECSAPKESYVELQTPDLTCSVTYYGPLKPRLTWWLLGEEQAGRIVEDSDDNGYVHILKLTVSSSL